jgi:hypothetical protein
MDKSIKVIFSPNAEEVYGYLAKKAQSSKTEKMIANAIQQKLEWIKADPWYGDSIAKRLIPREYQISYGITNLFRIELPNFWRLLYTLTDGETKSEISIILLDILDHTAYNKKFGYRKK